MAKEQIIYSVRETSMGGQSLLEGRKGSDKVLPFISIQVPTEAVYMLAAAPSMYEALKAQTAAIKSLMDELCCYMDHDPTPMIHAEAARRQGIEALSLASPEKNT